MLSFVLSLFLIVICHYARFAVRFEGYLRLQFRGVWDTRGDGSCWQQARINQLQQQKHDRYIRNVIWNLIINDYLVNDQYWNCPTNRLLRYLLPKPTLTRIPKTKEFYWGFLTVNKQTSTGQHRGFQRRDAAWFLRWSWGKFGDDVNNHSMLMPSTLTARFNSNGSSPSATLFHNLVSAQYSISRLIANRLDAVSWIEGCPSARVLVVSSESVSSRSTFYWCVNWG